MIFLIRHTTVDIPKGVCYGQADVGLCDSYVNELRMLRAQLPHNINLCYSSPSQRCRQLANDITPAGIIIDARLKELNFGDWELKRWADLGQAGRVWGNNFVTQRPPGGESFLDLQARVLAFWHEFSAKAGRQSSAIVTHAGVIRILLAHKKGLPLEQAFSIPVAYGQVILLNDV